VVATVINLRISCGQDLAFTLGTESRAARPVQAEFAFPGQGVGDQFGARPVLEPGGDGR